MIKSTQTVSGIIAAFREALRGRYPDREIDQFLVLAFEEVMHLGKVQAFTVADAPVGEVQCERFGSILEGLKRSEPIQYLLGCTVFYGLPLRVTPDVLIPRPETEELADRIVKDYRGKQPRIIDLGTGSGCIAMALKQNIPGAQVFGADNSVAALDLANVNAKSNQLDIEFFHFDILRQESLGFMDFDVIVSNPPYVTPAEKKQMDDNVLKYEPNEALFVPEDNPLLFYRKITALADGHLLRGGALYFEINRAYGNEIAGLLKDRGYAEVEVLPDLNGNDRMIRAIKR